MSDNTPKFSKQDLDKLLNCSDQLASTFNAFKLATKKLNDEREKVKKQAAGIPTTTKGSAYYNNIENKKALNKANNVIDNLVKQFSVDISNIGKNLGMLNSQVIYKKRLNDLIKYYKNNINQDKLDIERLSSKNAIANRMSTFYNDNSEWSESIKKYVMYLYWPVLIFSCVMLVFNAFHMPEITNRVRDGFVYLTNSASKSIDDAKKEADRLDKQARKVKNPLSSKMQQQILSGPGQQSRASAALAPTRFKFGGAKSKYSLYPWLTIVKILVLITFTIKILEFVTPYLNHFAFPKINY
jgi:cell fate (sporulation/competence/biofilm development) regulator YmcA (YheA/YmcA/DUF963 family)